MRKIPWLPALLQGKFRRGMTWTQGQGDRGQDKATWSWSLIYHNEIAAAPSSFWSHSKCAQHIPNPRLDKQLKHCAKRAHKTTSNKQQKTTTNDKLTMRQCDKATRLSNEQTHAGIPS